MGCYTYKSSISAEILNYNIIFLWLLYVKVDESEDKDDELLCVKVDESEDEDDERPLLQVQGRTSLLGRASRLVKVSTLL